MRSFEIALLRADATTLRAHNCPAAVALVCGDFEPALHLPSALTALKSRSVDSDGYSPKEHYVSGVACLLSFVRDNWAGPRQSSLASSTEDIVHVQQLSRDGEDVASSLRSVNLLIGARFLLVDQLSTLVAAGCSLAPWWAARVVLAHNSCLSAPTPTLQAELFSLFSRFLGPTAARTRFLFADALPFKRPRSDDAVQARDEEDDHELLPVVDSFADEEDEMHCVLPSAASDKDDPEVISLAVLAHVELALAQRAFFDPEGASSSISCAANIARMEIIVKGELGTRTKYQGNPTAQLIARTYQMQSSTLNPIKRDMLTGLDCVFPGDTTGKSDIMNQIPLPTNVPVNDSDALGYIKLVNNEEDSDGTKSKGNELGPEIHDLTPVDQLVVLALSAIVRAQNVEHLLTFQQMAPYVNLVLKNENSVFGTSSLAQIRALVVRVSFESDRGRFLERCMTQMETIAKFIDDNMESASEEVRNAATAERCFVAFASGVPPHWELKKQLAISLGKIGLVKSAMEIFKELEFWDELIDCHRLIGNIGAAQDLVQSQLKQLDDAVSKESSVIDSSDDKKADRLRKERAELIRATRRPRLLCVLGDVTRETKYFEQAWSESGERYTRAKRALGRFCIDTGLWKAAIEHFQTALAINPLFPEIWFSYGCAALEIDDSRTAAEAFTHVIRQTPDYAEGWNNLARALVDLGRKKEALKALCESARLMRDSWRVWENVLMLATELRSTLEALHALERLLELRNRDANIEHAICCVVEDVIRLAQSSKKEERFNAGSLCRRLLKILGKATTIVSTNASVWEAYSELHALVPEAGGCKKAFDCRLKQVRVLVAEAEWNREKPAFRRMVVASIRLCELAMEVDENTVLRAAELHLLSVLEQTQADFRNDTGFVRLGEAKRLLKEASINANQ